MPTERTMGERLDALEGEGREVRALLARRTRWLAAAILALALIGALLFWAENSVVQQINRDLHDLEYRPGATAPRGIR